jgi:subtilisin family serine protease
MNPYRVIKLIIPLVITGSVSQVNAQEQLKWLVTFTDKQGVEFNPDTYFDSRTVERRMRLGISLDQITDYPVKSEYLDSVRTKVPQILMTTRWFNGVVCYGSEEDMDEIRRYSFIDDIEFLPRPDIQLSRVDTEISIRNTELLRAQLKRFHAGGFKERGLDGSGIRIAVFDAGFNGYTDHPSISHLIENKRIVAVRNFVKPGKFIGGHSHGLMVLSCIAGIAGNQPMGLAPNAEFLLAKTENNFEFLSEEYQWLAAAEWADQQGADIINSSLGYTYHRYLPEEMNGTNSIVSRAANMAASKGITVINSAGNEGGDRWKIIGAPADADSVLSVGGIDPRSGLRIDFSSFGPNALKKRKPNVTAFGQVVTASLGLNTMAPNFGTSFSCPLVTGFAACVAQMDSTLRGMRLFKAIEESGDLYPYFDYAHGYGVPDARKFFKKERKVDMGLLLQLSDNVIEIQLDSMMPTSSSDFSESFDRYLFVKVVDEEGAILLYRVIDPTDQLPQPIQHLHYSKGHLYRYPKEDYPGASEVHVWYAGQYVKQAY